VVQSCHPPKTIPRRGGWFLSLLALCSLPGAGAAQSFRDGTHVVNEDDVIYELKYVMDEMTTAICDVVEPTPEVRRGLGAAADRVVPGFEVISREPADPGLSSRVVAHISGRTTVSCLCVADCAVEVVGAGHAPASQQTIVIRGGALHLK